VPSDRALANVLEPRMVALWKPRCGARSGTPSYLFDALKVYLMFTGKAPFDAEYVVAFWEVGFSGAAGAVEPGPENQTALDHQLAAIARRATDGDRYIDPTTALLAQALETRLHHPACRNGPTATCCRTPT
jgi:type VI secretion system protein ImpL